MDLPDADFLARGRALAEELLDDNPLTSVDDFTQFFRKLRDFFDEEDAPTEWRQLFANGFISHCLTLLPDVDRNADRTNVLRAWFDALGFEVKFTN